MVRQHISMKQISQRTFIRTTYQILVSPGPLSIEAIYQIYLDIYYLEIDLINVACINIRWVGSETPPAKFLLRNSEYNLSQPLFVRVKIRVSSRKFATHSDLRPKVKNWNKHEFEKKIVNCSLVHDKHIVE